MTALTLTITDSGRAALINAEHTGLAPVTIAEVGVSASAVDAAPSAAALPGEIKRLTTFSGAAIAADTLHITIRDDSTASYALRSFALYLNDGTLFALYGQSAPVMQKSANAMLLLSVDVTLVQIAATAITFGDANFMNPPATTEVQGVVELATTDEARAGTDQDRAITPAALKDVLGEHEQPWNRVTGKPDAFTPASHSHTMQQVGGLVDALNSKVRHIATAPEDISQRLPSGFYQRDGTGPGWPVQEAQWWHLLSLTHSNTGNYYALQLACKYGGHGLMFRNTSNNGNAPWYTLWHSGNFDPDSRLKLTGGTLTNTLAIAQSEASLRLRSTHPNGREINVLSNGTPNTGFYDITNAKWLFRIGGDDLVRMKGISEYAVVTATPTGNAHVALRDEENTNRALLFWHRETGSVRLRRYNAGQSEAELRISANNTLTYTGGPITAPGFNGTATSATKLTSSTKINGTSFNGTADIITARWGAERTFTIGSTGKAVNGTGNLTWTLAEIGAAASGHSHAMTHVDGLQAALNGKAALDHSHAYLPLNGGTVTGDIFIEKGGLESKLQLKRTPGSGGRTVHLTSVNDGNVGLHDETAGQWIFRIDASNTTHLAGSLTATNVTATASDARLKDDIEDLTDALAIVSRLQPRRWRWKENGSADFGFIAQEHRDVVPEAVQENDGMLYVRYGKLEAVLTAAVQELTTRLDGIEARIAALEMER